MCLGDGGEAAAAIGVKTKKFSPKNFVREVHRNREENTDWRGK